MSLPVVGTVAPGLQPWNQVVWPPSASNWPRVDGPMTPDRAKSLPAVARAIGLIAGMLSQCPMGDYKGTVPLPTPRLLDQPDPDQSRTWWVSVQVEDWLLNGNAVHYVTSRDAEGWPATTTWVPADWVSVLWSPNDPLPTYWVGGRELDRENVIHVRRGADRMCPWRGVGVVEQNLQTLRRVSSQDRYEQGLTEGAGVPSVAVITPNSELSQDEADAAQEKFIEKYGGEERKPGVFPNGTQVIPLSWSPADQQLNEARKLSLLDVANMFNLDGYWLGAPAGSFTYRSPGPMYLNLMRQTLGPILSTFEDVWTSSWLPRGRRVKFDRQAILGDDMTTTVTYLDRAVRGKLMTQSEAREYLGLSPDLPEELKAAPVPEQLQPDDPADVPDDDPQEVEQI